MRYQTRIFNSRISKRIFSTFVVCALVPLICLAVLAYIQITRHIREETFVNLRLSAKSQAKILTDRLVFLEKELELIGSLAARSPNDAFDRMPVNLRDRFAKYFKSITVFSQSNPSHTVVGHAPIDQLILQPDEIRHMTNGHTLLREVTQGVPSPMLLMVRSLADAPQNRVHIVGQVMLDAFWASDVLNNLPLDTGFCVFGFSANLLYPSTPHASGLIESIRMDMNSAISGHYEVDTDAGRHLASHTQLFLKPLFKLPHWDVVLFKSATDVFAPIADFKLIFPLVLLLAFIIVLWLSLVTIRRNLVPVEALKIGVKRIADNVFSHRVDVCSGDEFEELADAFNLMSGQLQKKFNEMNLIAGLGTHITTILDIEVLTRAVIVSIRKNLDYNRGAILLTNPSHHVVLDQHFGFHPDSIEQMRKLNLKPDGMAPQNPISRAYATQTSVLVKGDAGTGESILFHGAGPQAVICVPLVYEGTSLGVLVLTRVLHSGVDVQESDSEVLNGIAAQTAVSIANIDSFRKIRESEQRFRAAFDYSAGGILFIDPDGQLLRCNSFFCDMLGYAKDELLTKPYREIVHAKYLARTLASLDRMIQGDPDADSFESRYVHKDGSDVWGYVSTSLLRDASGAPLYFICLIQDLTAEKEAQREKQMLESQLQQSHKMEAIGTLAGGIAHDFNNILMAIYGFTQISMMKVQASGDSEINEHLEKIMTASERAKALVKQILTFSRRSTSEVESIELKPVIKETLKLLRATIPPNIEIKQNLLADSPRVMADSNQIHQVIMNLCTNAYHAVMEKGTGSIQVDMALESGTPEGALPLENKPAPDQPPLRCLKLSISDSGCGMDADTAQRIFDPYFTTKAEGQGTGLGLSVVHGIIKNHGGVITVVSVPGKGTTFDIFLPITQAGTPAEFQLPTHLPTGSEQVLVVDDEIDLTGICHMMLTDLGYTVICKNHPLEALIEFQSHPDQFDLVITDMAMPKMMGDELAERLIATRPNIPIICSTGYRELVRSRSERGELFSAYVDKPFTHEQLANVVRDALDAAGRSTD